MQIVKNWGSVEELNLPVNVTRTILPDKTTFKYSPEGDEKYIIFTGWKTGNEGPEAQFPNHNSLGFVPVEYPIIDLMIIRLDGREEHYTLLMRGGAVKG